MGAWFLDLLERLDDGLGGGAVSVMFEEEFGLDDAGAVDDEGAWMGDAVPAGGGLAVADAEGVDGLAFRVGQEREGDGAFLGESSEEGLAVVADGDDLAAGCLDGFKALLQLDQLRFAVGSPIGRAMEDEGDGAQLEEGGERAFLSVLIAEGEVGRGLADGEAGHFGWGGARGFGGGGGQGGDEEKEEPAEHAHAD